MSNLVIEEKEQVDIESILNSINMDIDELFTKLNELNNQVKTVSSKLNSIRDGLSLNRTLEQSKTIDISNENGAKGTILIVKHPVIDSLKLLVTLDNLKSLENLENIKADINKWFINLDDEFVTNYDLLYASFINQFVELVSDNEEMSVSGAILDSNKTMALSTTGKRIYSCVNGELYELALPSNPNYSFINSLLIDNDEYTTIILLSNSDEEEIEDNKIKIINGNTNRDSLAKELFESVQEDSSILTMVKRSE